MMLAAIISSLFIFHIDSPEGTDARFELFDSVERLEFSMKNERPKISAIKDRDECFTQILDAIDSAGERISNPDIFIFSLIIDEGEESDFLNDRFLVTSQALVSVNNGFTVIPRKNFEILKSRQEQMRNKS